MSGVSTCPIPTTTKWKVERIAKLTDAPAMPQPITTGVRIEIDQNNNVDRYLFVGTGKLLGKDDITDTTVGNTLYVIRDGTRTHAGPGAGDAVFARRSQYRSTAPRSRDSRHRATGRGWYQDGADPT